MNTEKQLQSLQKKRDLKQLYRKVFTSEEGRAILRDWLKIHYDVPKMTDTDAHRSFMEGQRAFILQVIHTAYDLNDFSNEIMSLIQETEENKKDNTYD